MPYLAVFPGVNVYVNGLLDMFKDIALGNNSYDPVHKVSVIAYGTTAMYVTFLDGECLRLSAKSRDVSKPRHWVLD